MEVFDEIKEVAGELRQNSGKENARIVVNIFFKSVLGKVPFFGNTALEIYGELQSKQIERKIKRLEEFYASLDAKIADVEDKVTKAYICKEDFLDVFEEATRFVVTERQEQKRLLFKNILANSIVDPACDYDKTEKYFRLLDNLGDLELRVLAVLENPEQYYETHEMIIKDPIHNAYQTSWNTVTSMGVLTQVLGLKVYQIEEAITVLFSNGLVVENSMSHQLNTNGNTIAVLNN